MTTAQDGGQIVSLTHRPPLPQGNVPGTHFCQRLSRPKGHSAIRRILCQRKLPMTPAGIELETLRFVAQHLDHCSTAVSIPGNDCTQKRKHAQSNGCILAADNVSGCSESQLFAHQNLSGPSTSYKKQVQRHGAKNYRKLPYRTEKQNTLVFHDPGNSHGNSPGDEPRKLAFCS